MMNNRHVCNSIFLSVVSESDEFRESNNSRNGLSGQISRKSIRLFAPAGV